MLEIDFSRTDLEPITGEFNEQRIPLFFSHQLKVGDPIQLAREVRRGLDQTNSEGSP